MDEVTISRDKLLAMKAHHIQMIETIDKMLQMKRKAGVSTSASRKGEKMEAIRMQIEANMIKTMLKPDKYKKS